MKVLITGSNGQLGRSIQERSLLYPEFSFDFTDVDQLDITNKSALEFYLKTSKPDVIINCAAYTAVDKAEEEKEKAFLLNVTAVEYLSQISVEYGILLIHISTDFIFDGKSTKFYKEDNFAQPESVYGKSKLAGEKAIKDCGPNAIIIRTSWLYSEYGHNFVKTILRLASERSEIKVVSDQVGTPTYAGDLADAILKIIHSNYQPEGVQVFHYSNEGVASWYDFAKAIIEIDNLDCSVIPIPASKYTLPAKRPDYSVMSKEKFKQYFHLEIPEWKESLKVCLKNLS